MSGDLKLLRVGVRMLLDYLRILDEDQKDFEVGCKCKSEAIAEDLKTLLWRTLADFPVRVVLKDEVVVVLLPPVISEPPVTDGDSPDSPDPK